MTAARRWLWAALVLLLGVLAAYLVPALQLRSAREEIAALRESSRLADLQAEAALMFLETCQKNYGLAREHASRFFDQLRVLRHDTSDPARRQALEDVLQLRDRVIAGLAQGDAGVMPAVETAFRKLRQLSERT